jgi:hypothetical protein
MSYYINRSGQEYGPYTLADLQRYVASGNILPTDVVRGEGITGWVPVSQVIGNVPAPAPAPTPATTPAQVGMAPAMAYPDPPSLHWGIALLLGIVTCGIFGWVWAFVEASWAKKVDPASKAAVYWGIAVALFAVSIVLNLNPDMKAFGGLTNIAGVVLWILGAFNMKASIEQHYNSAEPIGLKLSGVMTFFFNVYYFQYHFTKLAEMRQNRALRPMGT